MCRENKTSRMLATARVGQTWVTPAGDRRTLLKIETPVGKSPRLEYKTGCGRIGDMYVETFAQWVITHKAQIQTQNQKENLAMTNVNATVKGNKLILEVDLSERHGKSGSGKTTIVGTSGGNQAVEGHPGVFFGLNVYCKP